MNGFACSAQVKFAVDVCSHHRVAGFGVERLLGRGVEDQPIDALSKPVVRYFL